MKKLFLIVMFFIASLPAMRAQNNDLASLNEALTQKQYPGDPVAEAAILSDVGRSFFESGDEGFSLYFERKTRVKIYKKAGLKWGEIEIPFYFANEGIERIYDIIGATYNLEDGIVKSTPLAIDKKLEEKVDKNWRIMKFAMPNVKEGSVIDISYKISSPYLFNLRSWDFQYKIPIKYSEYRTCMNPFYEYIYILQGTNQLSGFNSFVDPGMSRHFGSMEYHDMIYEFVMKDVPAFRDEAFISSANDYMIKLNFQLSKIHYPTGGERKIMSTWENLVKEMLGSEGYAGYLSDAEKKAKAIVDTMKFKSTDPLEKTKAVESYVKNNFSWNGDVMKFPDSSLKELLKTKRGNSAQINLFLIGMLRAAGIETTPVLLSTRGHGKIFSDYPFLHFFNYVIAMAKVGEDLIPLDATDPLSKFMEIPPVCFNDKGLLLKKENAQWITINNPGLSNSTYVLDLQPDPIKENVSGKIKIETTGYDALKLREQYQTNFKQFKSDILPSTLTLADSIKTNNLSQYEKSFEVNFGANTPLEKVEDKLIISPFCNLSITENPLKGVSRSYPIDMNYKKEKKYVATIQIPKGYKVFSKPEDLKLSNKLGIITFTTEIIDNQTLKIIGSYKFNNDVINADQYYELKGFFNKIVDKFNEKVICIKG
ncbi:MAG: transglutaminase domain-containing protein [Bacteroidota bacterium]|nr:transglutaminase domain-containing protein [Bacteroidota bacterium]